MIGLATRFGAWFVAGLLAGFVALVLAPIALGWRPYTVLTGSMQPTIAPGDVVMDRPLRIADAEIGDVITFSDPTRGGDLVTHRIRSIARGPQETTVETRGDANATSERWTIRSSDEVGQVAYVLPQIGRLATLVRTPAGVLLLVVLPILAFGFLTLRSIWRSDDTRPQPAAGGRPGAGEADDAAASAAPIGGWHEPGDADDDVAQVAGGAAPPARPPGSEPR